MPSAPQAPESPDRWVDRYGDQLYRYALARTRDPHLAEDLVQETLLAALKARRDFQGRSSVKTWLVAILKNKIIDHLRRVYREQPLPEPEADTDPVDVLFNERGHWKDSPGDWRSDPGEALEQRQFLEIFEACLAQMPPRLAQAFTLREMDGLSPKEICKVMNVSPSNSWVILYRARMRLRECIGRKWPGADRRKAQ